MFVRPSFNLNVKALFPTGANQNICHVLSWQYMNTVMGNLIQELPETEAEMQQWLDSFHYFVRSICLPEQISEEYQLFLAREIQNDDETFWNRYVSVSNTIKGNVEDSKQKIINQVYFYYTETDVEERISIRNNILTLSRELLEFLNSMPTNLKIGNASWNQSIGGAVDPRAWVSTTENPSLFTSIEEGERNDVVIVSFSKDSYPVDVEEINKSDGEGFVLTHPVDHIQLTCAFNIDPKFVNPATYLYTGVYATQEQGLILTVCSSSNPLSMINSDVNHQSIPIYVKHLNLDSPNEYQWLPRY